MKRVTFPKSVTRHTRAGLDGKMIQCPCGFVTRVYHFNWCALECWDDRGSGCGEMVEKHAWFVEK